jgi:hypothetical protein
MLFNDVFTEEKYKLHLEFLNSDKGVQLILKDADLRNCTGNNKEVKSFDGTPYLRLQPASGLIG